MLLLPVRELAWYARSPDDDGLLPVVIPEELGSPYVDGGGVAHHLDKALLAPVLQVLGRSIAKATVTTPRAGPYQMEGAVGCADD